jgi:S-adenosylmethionine decarboxylase proenzyme
MNKQVSAADAAAATKVASFAHPPNGRHLLLRLSGCQFDILNDEARICELAKAAAIASRATVLNVASHHFSPQGVTAVVLLAESHASLHTYPEAGIVFWDCFTCGETCDPRLSIEVLRTALKPTSQHVELIIRS